MFYITFMLIGKENKVQTYLKNLSQRAKKVGEITFKYLIP